MSDQATLSDRWQTLARRTAWKVNLGWCLERSIPGVILGSLTAFALILWMRSRAIDADISRNWLWVLATLSFIFLTGLFLAKKHFITPAQAMVRLESHLQLHNALTVAKTGRSPWPELPNPLKDGWKWRWSFVTGPWLLALICIALAFWIPIPHDIVVAQPTMEPQAWQQMDQWLEKLEEEKLITPEEKEEQAAKIAELRDQPPEKWFSHDSLHASDSLKEQLQRDMAQIAQNMTTVERSLNALQNYADKLSQSGKDQLLKDMDEALKGLQNSPLELNPELLKELSQIDPKNLKSLSPEKLKQLRDALKKGASESQGMSQKTPGFLGDGEGEDDELAEMLGGMGGAQGEGGEEGDNGEGKPGKGGVSRGPGTAPLTLSDEENDFGTDKNEAISNDDLSRAQLGTMLGVQNGKHEVDHSYQGPSAAGSAAHEGQGGEQVWRETLTPDEKAVLKRVFR